MCGVGRREWRGEEGGLKQYGIMGRPGELDPPPSLIKIPPVEYAQKQWPEGEGKETGK